MRFRQVAINSRSATAHRTGFELTFAGTDATLIETEDEAEGVLAIADLDHASWMRRATRMYRGPRHGNDLELATSGMQPLQLHCEDRRMIAAPVDAGTTCDHDPRRAVPINALVCVAGGQDLDAADGDDRLVFAAPIGVEWISLGDECFAASGFRLARG